MCFDMDGSGHISLSELLRIGRAYGTRAAKQWSPEQADGLLASMDADEDGQVSKVEFRRHLDRVMPQNSEDFAEALACLRAAAAGARHAAGKATDCRVSAKSMQRYDGVIDGLRKIVEEEGFLALFKGVHPRFTSFSRPLLNQSCLSQGS